MGKRREKTSGAMAGLCIVRWVGKVWYVTSGVSRMGALIGPKAVDEDRILELAGGLEDLLH